MLVTASPQAQLGREGRPLQYVSYRSVSPPLSEVPNTHGRFCPPSPCYLPSYAYVQTREEITCTKFGVATSNYALCTPPLQITVPSEGYILFEDVTTQKHQPCAACSASVVSHKSNT
jgi:hypothetical protein